MAITTAVTTLKVGTLQVETATIVGTITLSGNATVTVTGADITGSPVAVSVAVLNGDTPNIVAIKMASAINLNVNISAKYVATAVGYDVVLTRLVPIANDATLNIAYTNGTCAGLTPDATSVDTIAGVALAKLVDITNYPDLGASPSKLDTTDLTQPTYKTSELGLQEIPDLTFECNYVESTYDAITAMLLSLYYFSLEFGDSDGKFTWTGDISIFVNGAGVDEIRKMTVTTSTATPIEFSAT